MICNHCGKESPAGMTWCGWCGYRLAQEKPPRKTTKRRGNGQGYAYKCGKTWKLVVTVGYKDEEYSHRTRRTKSGFATKAEALAYAPQLLNRAEQPNGMTLKAAYDKWFATIDTSKSTKDCYQAGFKVWEPVWHILLTRQDIDELQECVDDSGKGKRTLQNAKVCLGLVYKWAIPRGYAEINLAQFIKVGDGETRHKEGFTDKQLQTIRDGIGIVPYADYIYCACYLGFRPSELLDLKLSDYDREHNCFVGGSKTEAGKNRVVTVSPKIQPYVDKLIETAVTSTLKDPHVFGANSARIPLVTYRKVFYCALAKLGIQDESTHLLTPHSCRHTFATLMKRVSGADKDKMALIGHASGEMLRYYQDVAYDDLKSITDKI